MSILSHRLENKKEDFDLYLKILFNDDLSFVFLPSRVVVSMKELHVVLLLLLLLGVISSVSGEECNCTQIPSIEIVNDEQIATNIQQIRDEFLSRQVSNKFDRLSATVLIRQGNSATWKRGSVEGRRIEYPASTVKLMYMYAAIEWCKDQNLPIDCLDRYVRPMVVVSSNLDTGYVVDAITNTTNIDDLTSTNDTRWAAWFDRRLSTERLLQKLNLYDNQVLRSKTYPTNSGQGAVGSESVLLRGTNRRNLLQPCCTASFMLFLMHTRPQNELDYMKGMLYRTLESDHTTFGNGLPAGTTLHSKVGNAYDTVEEIASIVLPNGQEMILSAFSNGYQRRENDFYILGRFAEMVVQKFSTDNSSTTIFTFDDLEAFNCTGDFVRQTSALPKDTLGASVLTFNDSCTFYPVVGERGIYTVSLWTPSLFDSKANVNVAVTDAYNITDGDDGFVFDQQTTVSRWISVGDFLLNPGRQEIYLKALNQQSLFNAIRFSRRPPLTIDRTVINLSTTSTSNLSCSQLFALVIFLLFLSV